MVRSFILVLLLLTSTLFSQSYIYETLTVDQIEINVLNTAQDAHYQREAILAKMKTKIGRSFSQIDFDEDLKGLASEYDDINPDISVCEGKIQITLNIALKPIISAIRWCGNEQFDQAKLQRELGLSAGSVYDRAGFNRAVFNVQKFYVKKGFFESEIDYSIEYNAETNEVELLISVFEGRSGKIREVKFVNFTYNEESALSEMLVTRPWNFIMSFFAEIGIYSEERMLQDQFIIINYLQNQGYADATVTIEPVETPSRGKIDIVITAQKGEQYKVGNITIEGNEIFSQEEILCALGIKEGDPFSPENIHNATTAVRDLYGMKGYIDATVEFDPTLDLSEPVYHLDFLISEGGQYRVGLIRIIGNLCTANSVLLHECLLVPGDVFDIRKLKASEVRLRNIGYFKSVNVYAVRTDELACDGSNYRDVVIEVVEDSTGNFSAFLGVSSMEDLFGGFSICEKNFNIRGLGTFLGTGFRGLRGGGEYAYFNTTIGAESLKYQASWAKPYFMDTPWIVGVDFDRSWIRYISNDYTIGSWGLRPYARYPINGYTTFGSHYRIRNSNVEIKNLKDPPPKLIEQSKNRNLISAVGGMLHYDSTDHPIFPTHGIRSRYDFEFVGAGGYSHFFNTGWLNSLYYPLFGKGVFKVRADVKFIFPLPNQSVDTIPLDEKFFLGGIGSVRGYEDFSLGPQFVNAVGGETPTTDPSGGISLNLYSLEYTYRYSKFFEPFAFFDAGSLTDSPFSFGPYYTSAGIGLRSCIMPGSPPLTLGIGWPINNPTNAPAKNFFFSLGGNF